MTHRTAGVLVPEKGEMTPAQRLAAILRGKPSPRRRRGDMDSLQVWDCTTKDLRKEVGLTQQEVARALNLSLPTVYRLEQGHNVALDVAVQVAEFYGKSVEDVWKLRPEELGDVPTEYERRDL